MSNTTDQIYNACASLPGQYVLSSSATELSPMERHQLRSSLYRIRVALGELAPAETEGDAAAAAYMAGYEEKDAAE